jgi:hypothetical protein
MAYFISTVSQSTPWLFLIDRVPHVQSPILAPALEYAIDRGSALSRLMSL